MGIIYTSTRGGKERLRASEAIIKGLADDGGLFVPDHFPAFDFDLDELGGIIEVIVHDDVMIVGIVYQRGNQFLVRTDSWRIFLELHAVLLEQLPRLGQ